MTPDSAAPPQPESEPLPSYKPVDSDPSWDEITPPRRGTTDDAGSQWSASEVTLARAPKTPDSEDSMPLAPPIIAEAESETSGTIIVPEGRKRSRPSVPVSAHMLAGTRAGIELGRPVYAVAAIGATIALGALLLAGTHAGAGAAIGAGTATLNLWMFTRIGSGFVSRRGLRASWGVLAGLKLVVLFGGVAALLKLDLADPVAFVVGYLALPIGIVASQLLGLQPDFEES
jgi:hypothetical protein